MSLSQDVFDGEVFTALELQGARLEDRTFYDCRFERCSFNEASFRRSRFMNCTFFGCDLSMADPTDAELSGVTFENTALVAVNASVLVRPVGGLELRFRGCTLNYMTFRDLELSGSVFEDSLVHEAVFSGTKLVKTSFRGSNLLNSTFSDCDLSHADLRGATNYQISTKRNTVKGLKASFPEVVGLLAGLELVIA